MLASCFLLLGLSAAQAFASTQHGTVGYGIDIFRPYCCTSCADSLMMVYLNCTTFEPTSGHGSMNMKLKKRMDMDMGMEGVTSEECYATDQPYQQTFAYCVKSHCDAEGVSYDEQNKCFQGSNSAGPEGLSLEQSLPLIAPIEELAEDAEWLNTTMLVNGNYWKADRGTIQVFAEIEKDHNSWSIAIFILSVSVPILRGAYSLLTSKLPLTMRQTGGLTGAFHSYMVLPALGSNRHSQPLAGKAGYVPTRGMTVWITIYVILNVLGSSIGFRSVQPNSWYANRTPEIAAYVANRTGVLSFANMALAILFASRNNPLLYLSGWDQTTQLTFHRWSSRVAVLQAVVHSIVYTADFVSYKGENTYAIEAAVPYFWWGIIGTTAMALMIGFSAMPVRAYAYEFFLVTHILLAILSLLGCWYHIITRFQTKYGYEVWLYLAFAFWSYDRLVRIVRTVYYSYSRRPTARLEAVEGTNVTMMTISLRKPLKVGPGRHTYVYFPSLGKFWESHPFTVCDWDDHALSNDAREIEASQADVEKSDASVGIVNSASGDIDDDKKGASVWSRKIQETTPRVHHTHYIRCLFRSHKGVTSSLRAELSPGEPLSLPIATEGTYGGQRSSHLALEQADHVICIAGGIGITHAASFARQFTRDRLSKGTRKQLMPRCSKFVLAWTVREEALLAHCQRHLLPSLQDIDDGSIQYRFWVTGSSDAQDQSGEDKTAISSVARRLAQQNSGRMDVREAIGSVMAMDRRVAVVVCGPGSLADDVRAEAVRCSRLGFVVDLLEESFSW